MISPFVRFQLGAKVRQQPQRTRGPLRRAIAQATCAVLLGGCATVEQLSDLSSAAQTRAEAALQSARGDAAKEPRNAGLRIDYLLQRDQLIQELLPFAEDMRAEGKIAQAREAFERVLRLDPANPRARMGLASLEQDSRNEKLLTQGEEFLAAGKTELALDRVTLVLEAHPQSRRAAKLREAIVNARSAADVERTRERAARATLDSLVTLQFRDATLRNVFESLAKSAGLNILFDKDVRQDSMVTIFVKDVSVSDTVDLILMQNQLDKRVINANTLVIYPLTAAKQAEYEELTIRSFQVTNADVKYLSQLLKTMLKIREVAADERTEILVLRDTAERLRLAERLIVVHDMPDPEIMLEVEVLEVSSSRSSNLGVKLPNSFGVTTPGAQGTLTLARLEAMKRGELLVTPLSTTLNFKLEDAEAKILASPRIRARNKEKARIMIGDRVPTVTNTVTPLSTGSSVVTSAVSYQDVGLKLEFEPQVYSESEVGIKISLEVSNIAQEFTDAQGGRSYQIGTRNANTVLRLKDGETQILGGLITDQDRSTAAKLPGLGHLPIIGRIFGNNDGSSARSEIVLAITPRIVRNLAVFSPETKNIFSGTANMLREKPILSEPATIRTEGTFGGTPATGPSPSGAGGGARPVPLPQPGSQIPGVTRPASEPLINRVQAAPPTLGTGSSSGGGSLLPPPPPLIVRPLPGSN